MSVKVKYGTPMHGPSLCETCERAHVMKGYRESEFVVICRATYDPQLRVTFNVRECSSYVGLGRKRLDDMEEIAWTLVPRGSKRQAGFVAPRSSTNDQREIELVVNDNDDK